MQVLYLKQSPVQAHFLDDRRSQTRKRQRPGELSACAGGQPPCTAHRAGRRLHPGAGTQRPPHSTARRGTARRSAGGPAAEAVSCQATFAPVTGCWGRRQLPTRTDLLGQSPGAAQATQPRAPTRSCAEMPVQITQVSYLTLLLA